MVEYGMASHKCGAVSLLFCANHALQGTALIHKEQNNRVKVGRVNSNFCVDEYLISFAEEDS